MTQERISDLGSRISDCRSALRPLRLCGAIFLLLLVAGCGPSKAQRDIERALNDYFVGAYPAAIERIAPLADKTNGDFVLNNCRLGSVALAAYDLDLAEAAFLKAYEVINSVGVSKGGRTLGALVVQEDIKVWKGEPFERAMANFYLGLVYYMRRDYPNARAAFENALFKLRDYGDKDDRLDQYREQESDFAVALIMLGKSYQRLGRDDLAAANFRRAFELRPELADLADPNRNAQSNVLLVVDYGHGPRKTTTWDTALVGFTPKPHEAGPIPSMDVIVNGRRIDHGRLATPLVDLLALAQDRRWQSIDTIRAAKSAVGTGLMAAGAYQGLKKDPEYKSAAVLLLAGAMLKASSRADVRHWELLPRTTFLVPLALPPGKHDVTVRFPAWMGLSQTWRGIVAPEQGEATYYIRMQRWNSGPFDWPPAGWSGSAHVVP